MTDRPSNVFHGPNDLRGSHLGTGNIYHGVQPGAEGRTTGPRTGQSSIGPTVGLITALPEELSAVQALIEDITPLPGVAGDNAAYERGSMPSRLPGQPHVVVLTMLPQAGNDAAATACTNLRRSFPEVRHVVMVGIAAGVPAPARPSHHVRLGDIVVAEWGVVDYDHVDVRPDGVRLRGGFPSRLRR
ncbi:hypothetical protein ACFQY4_26510 [Catellatospora bangladeshensis]|uniref:hypothetical protein n=1 Tax=Catellatospora bangladeshensis TaxID=310355 RepID=UPI00361ABFAD